MARFYNLGNVLVNIDSIASIESNPMGGTRIIMKIIKDGEPIIYVTAANWPQVASDIDMLSQKD